MAETERGDLEIKIKEVLDASDLTEDEKGLWLKHLESSPDSFLAAFLTIFEEDQSELKYTTSILKKKIEAWGDKAKYKEIIEEEKNHLLKLIKE